MAALKWVFSKQDTEVRSQLSPQIFGEFVVVVVTVVVVVVVVVVVAAVVVVAVAVAVQNKLENANNGFILFLHFFISRLQTWFVYEFMSC